MYKKYGNKFMCFSPPVMLATFLIEFGLLFYVLWRYKLTPLSRLAAVFLACLGIFQLAEYMICGGLGLGGVEWVKLGYVAITFLPALGLHIVSLISKASIKPILYAAYGSAALFAAFFIGAGSAVSLDECAPNYTVFNTSELTTLIYGIFYYGWLLFAIGFSAYQARKNPKVAPALRWMVASYAVFIVPTTVANIINPTTTEAIPSIMCGFAILCAIILVWRVLPLSHLPVRATNHMKNQNA
jgi:hypothetical protein